MSVIGTLTLRQIRASRRFLVTVLGVILSAAMVSAVLIGLDSAFYSLYQAQVASNGAVHWSATCQPDNVDAVEQAARDSGLFVRLGTRGFTAVTGLADANGVPYTLPRAVDACYVNGDYLTIKQVRAEQGTLPAAAGEAAILPDLALAIGCEVGDTLYLTTSDGAMAACRITAIVDSVPLEDTFGGVTYGILLYDAPLAGIPVSSTYLCGEAARYDAAFLAAAETLSADMQRTYGISASVDQTLAAFAGIRASDDPLSRIRQGLTVVLLCIIAAGSALLIVNSFSISLAQRRRTLGLLASVGATRAQKNAFVLYEAALVGLIGIPLGLAAGCGGLDVTFALLNRTVLANPYVQAWFSEGSFSLQLVVRPQVLLASAAAAAAVLLLSAWLPARRAARVSAMDAIRGAGEIRVKRRRSGLIGRLFGPAGILAAKSAKRSYRRYLATVASLTISVVLLISASGLSLYLEKSFSLGHSHTECQVEALLYTLATSEENDAWRQMLLHPDTPITSVTVAQEITYDRLTLSGAQLSSEQQALCRADTKNSVWLGQDSFSMQPHIQVVSDAQFRALAGRAAEPDGQNLDCVLVNGYIYRDPDGGYTEYADQTTLQAGDTLSWDFNTMPITLRLTAIADGDDLARVEEGWSLDTWGNPWQLRFVTSESAVEAVYQQFDATHDTPSRRSYTFHYQTKDARALTAELESLPDTADNWVSVANREAEMAGQQALLLLMRVLLYGFVTLIGLICTANIANTVSTGIALRRREFAMLQSVGMTPRTLRHMVLLESVQYGIQALLWGLPLSLAALMLEWRMLRRSYRFAFLVPWGAVAAAVLGVFLLTAAVALPALHTLRRRTLVEELRRDVDA